MDRYVRMKNPKHSYKFKDPNKIRILAIVMESKTAPPYYCLESTHTSCKHPDYSVYKNHIVYKAPNLPEPVRNYSLSNAYWIGSNGFEEIYFHDKNIDAVTLLNKGDF